MFNHEKPEEDLIAHETRPGYYQIPGFPKLYINREQTVLDSRTDTELMSYVGYYDYMKVDVVGLKSGILIHRAMAETFLSAGSEDPRKFQVNHKSGDKLDNSIGNLEFVTRSQNSVHAFIHGLRTDNRPLLCKDLRTGEVTEYYSMSECSRKIASNQGYLSNYMKGSRSKPVMGIYEVIFRGEEWKGFPPELVRDHPKRVIVGVVLHSESRKEVREYLGRTEPAAFLGLSVNKFTKLLDENGEHDGWKIYYSVDFQKEVVDPIHRRILHDKRARGRKPPKPIRVTDMDTGVVQNWISTERFARSHGVNKKTIQKSMGVKNGRWCNFKIEYSDN